MTGLDFVIPWRGSSPVAVDANCSVNRVPRDLKQFFYRSNERFSWSNPLYFFFLFNRCPDSSSMVPTPRRVREGSATTVKKCEWDASVTTRFVTHWHETETKTLYGTHGKLGSVRGLKCRYTTRYTTSYVFLAFLKIILPTHIIFDP